MRVKFLPWKEDEWLSRDGTVIPWDKAEHFLIALIAMFVLTEYAGFFPQSVAAMLLLVGAGWEARDGLVPYDKEIGIIQGFSWMDLIADAAGILLGWGLCYVV